MIEGLVGLPVEITPLGGMSGAGVVRAAGPDATVVAKGPVSARELAVYHDLRPIIDGNGVRIPARRGVVEDAGLPWWLLEDVPTALPSGRWLADPEAMATLASLHGLPGSVTELAPDPFRPAWNEVMDRDALEWFRGEHDLPDRLAALRRGAGPLFDPLVPVSDDPNPTNWGVSSDGDLVLIDWERIGLGHPALDVAITMLDLPGPGDFRRVADAYERAVARVAPQGASSGRPSRPHRPAIPATIAFGPAGEAGRFTSDSSGVRLPPSPAGPPSGAGQGVDRRRVPRRVVPGSARGG